MSAARKTANQTLPFRPSSTAVRPAAPATLVDSDVAWAGPPTEGFSGGRSRLRLLVSGDAHDDASVRVAGQTLPPCRRPRGVGCFTPSRTPASRTFVRNRQRDPGIPAPVGARVRPSTFAASACDRFTFRCVVGAVTPAASLWRESNGCVTIAGGLQDRCEPEREREYDQ